MLQSGHNNLMMAKDESNSQFDVCLSMSMYPPDKEQDTECNVCGAPIDMEHHPNCPVPAGEEIFLMDADIVNIMTNALAKSSMDYMKKKKEKHFEELATTRFENLQKDYIEMGSFAQALFDAGMLLKAEDVVFFIQNTSKFEPYYLLWMELNRPQEGDETWQMFYTEIWNRIMKGSNGKQTKDTGN
jgi:hypothetical protein